jgi:acetolactate synthase I/II/III large subunit
MVHPRTYLLIYPWRLSRAKTHPINLSEVLKNIKDFFVKLFAKKNVAQFIVECLENEGVEYIFGIPGEENIYLMDALRDSKIRFILTRHEQGAAFMADIYGLLTGKAGVCLSTLGPGAINLQLGVANAYLDRSPLVALIAQAATNKLHKISHQVLDLVSLFRPMTKWVEKISAAETTAEIVRKAFKVAQTEPQSATAIIIPQDIFKKAITQKPLLAQKPKEVMPNQDRLEKAADEINKAKHPIILVGYDVGRSGADKALIGFIEKTHIPAATTFMGKGSVPESHPYCIGTLGFMQRDYTNFGFDLADLVITIGYDVAEYAPGNWNPKGDKKIIHVNKLPAEVDSNYILSAGIEGDLAVTLNELANRVKERKHTKNNSEKIKKLIAKEIKSHTQDNSFPLKPQKIVADIRAAMGDDDIVLCDTGALKMWMARLYPCYKSNTCIFSNTLATMGFALPAALAAKLVNPHKKILVATGDGSFLMNSQELETAKREKIPFVVLIWRDDGYGLIKWREELAFGRSSFVEFTNPDYVKYAASFGIKGYKIEKAEELLPTLKEALAINELVIIDCQVDYSENMKLTSKLGGVAEGSRI